MSLQAALDRIYGRQRTLVFGHRGASAYAPMNTLPAFELAADQGADGIELDVHLCADGELVIVHDFTVDATTDGEGAVTEMTLAQLKALDAGSWFDPEFAGTRVPTLSEVFESVGDRLIVNVEIKSLSLETDGVEQAIADTIARHGMQENVIVSSFNPRTLVRFRQIMPEIPIGYLYAPDLPEMSPEIFEGFTYEAIHPFRLMVDEAHMTHARKNGYHVTTWTVNDPEEARSLRDLGVEIIITDKPDVIREALAR